MDAKDRTGQVWEVWSGLMVVVGPPTRADRHHVVHPCMNLDRDGRLFLYAEGCAFEDNDMVRDPFR